MLLLLLLLLLLSSREGERSRASRAPRVSTFDGDDISYHTWPLNFNLTLSISNHFRLVDSPPVTLTSALSFSSSTSSSPIAASSSALSPDGADCHADPRIQLANDKNTEIRTFFFFLQKKVPNHRLAGQPTLIIVACVQRCRLESMLTSNRGSLLEIELTRSNTSKIYLKSSQCRRSLQRVISI